MDHKSSNFFQHHLTGFVQQVLIPTVFQREQADFIAQVQRPRLMHTGILTVFFDMIQE